MSEIYKCEVCGNVVNLFIIGGGELVCCDEPMKKQDPKPKENEGKEKHIPVIEKTNNGVKVSIGSNPHPMEEKHYIALVQLLKNGKVIEEKILKPDMEPVVEFCIADTDNITAREYCTIHGLWES